MGKERTGIPAGGALFQCPPEGGRYFPTQKNAGGHRRPLQ